MGFDQADLNFIIGADTAKFDTSMARILAGAKRTAAAFIGFGSLGAGLAYIAKEAMASEKANTLLSLSLDNARNGGDAMLRTMDNLSKKMAGLSGFTDDQVKGAFTNMTNATGDADVALKSMQPAIDLAIAKNMDLGSAANIVARAYMNGGRVLGKLVPDLKNVGKGMEAVNAIGKKFTGSMDAYGDTAEGKFKRAKAQLDMMASELGTILLPILGDLADAIGRIAKGWNDWFAQFTEAGQIETQRAAVAVLNKEYNEWLDLKKKYEDKYSKKELSNSKQYMGITDEVDRLRIKKAVEEGRLKGMEGNLKPPGKGTKTLEEEIALTDEQEMLANAAEFEEAPLDEYTKALIDAIDATESFETIAQNAAQAATDAFAELGRSMAKGDFKNALNEFAVAGISAFIDAIETRIKAIMALDLLTGNIAGVALGGVQIGVLEGLKTFAATKINPAGAAKGVYGFNEPLVTSLQPNEMIVPPNVSDGIAQGKLTLGGPGGAGGDDYHVHIHTDNLTDPGRIMREQIAPAFKEYIVQHHGGKISRANGAPTF